MRAQAAILAILTIAVSTMNVLPAQGAGPVHKWSKQFGGPADQSPAGMVIDPDGNIVLTGPFVNSVSFGGATLTSQGGTDVFLAKLTANGDPMWSKRFGDITNQYVYAVAVSGTGDILIAGEFVGTIDFGGGPLTASPDFDAFVAKFDADGSHLWSARFGNATGQQGAVSAAFDSGGNMLVAGYSLGGSLDLGGDPLVTTFSDGWLAKFNPSGAHLWSRRIGDVSTDPADGSSQVINVVAADPSDDVLITGLFSGTTDFGGGPTTAVYQDMFLTRYDPSGVYVRNQTFSSGEFSYVNASAMAIDASGNVTVGGAYWGTVDFGGGFIHESATSLFLVSFDATGAHRWSYGFPRGLANPEPYSLDCSVNGIGIGPGGDVSFTGFVTDSLSFGGDWLATGGGGASFLAKFDANGVHTWSKGFGRGEGISTAVDNLGDVYVTGYISGNQPVSFGGDSFTPQAHDVFVARFGDGTPLPVLITRFDARPADAGVAVRWDLWSDEAIESFTLLRGEGAAMPSAIAEISDPRARSYVDRSVDLGTRYQYGLVVHTRDGDTFRSPIVAVSVAPLGLALGENHPNPFNPQTTIPYQLPGSAKPQHVQLRVVDAAGRVVRTLVDEDQSGGSRSVVWNGRDDRGNPVSSGVYFSVLRVGKEQRTSKVVMLK